MESDIYIWQFRLIYYLFVFSYFGFLGDYLHRFVLCCFSYESAISFTFRTPVWSDIERFTEWCPGLLELTTEMHVTVERWRSTHLSILRTSTVGLLLVNIWHVALPCMKRTKEVSEYVI